MPSTLTADCSFSTADSSTSTLLQHQLFRCCSQKSSFVSSGPRTAALSHWQESQNKGTLSVLLCHIKLHCHITHLFSTSFILSTPLPPPAVKDAARPFVCVKLNVEATGNVCCCEESWRDSRSVSLSTSLQPSFMPLSLAQRLTLRTPLSSLTLLHTGPRFWPQQYIDLLLRRLINISRCANAVHPRGGGVYIH